MRSRPRAVSVVAMAVVALLGCSHKAKSTTERTGDSAKPVAMTRGPLPATVPAAADPLREGDIVFQTSRSLQSQAIQLATKSRYSHVGIVQIRDGHPFVYEAVGPVKLTPLAAWITHGEGGHYVGMRLRRPEGALTATEIASLRRAAARFRGRPYDLAFEWSDARIYCSELVWKIYKEALGIELTTLQHLGDFDLTSNPIVRAKVHERYGDDVPLREPVVSPGALAESVMLETVREE